jgi:hypothetical protein
LGGGALLYLIFILLAPWNFYFGGHFHLVPGWTGQGWMHSSAAGGNYFLLVRFEPTVPGYRKSPSTEMLFSAPRKAKSSVSISAGTCRAATVPTSAASPFTCTSTTGRQYNCRRTDAPVLTCTGLSATPS